MKFREFAASSLGSKYAEKNWNCQDSADKMEFGKVQAVAVADGHGGSNYFRSQIGSKLAVETVFNQAKIFCKGIDYAEKFSDNGIKNFLHSLCDERSSAVKQDWYDRQTNIF